MAILWNVALLKRLGRREGLNSPLRALTGVTLEPNDVGELAVISDVPERTVVFTLSDYRVTPNREGLRIDGLERAEGATPDEDVFMKQVLLCEPCEITTEG